LNEGQLKNLYSQDYVEKNSSVLASYEDYLANHGFHYSLKILRDLLGSNSSICDFGCGTDETISNLAKQVGAKYVGVEYEPSVVMSLSKNKPENEYYSLTEFIERDSSFDVIFVGDVIEHVPSPSQLLKLISQRVAPHGRIVIQGPLENAPTTLHGLVKIKSLLIFKRAVSNHPYHVSLASRHSILELFSRNGLQVVEFKTYEVMWPVHSILERSKKRFLSPIFFAKFIDFQIQRLFPKAGNRFLAILKSSNLDS
jgi:2-polyprenyl-3-methyl-5-hydroxy-6-metoxy-1,4-benzoquinol methylase